VGDLWNNPVAVASHLASLSVFLALPTLESRDPRPTPELPPGGTGGDLARFFYENGRKRGCCESRAVYAQNVCHT